MLETGCKDIVGNFILIFDMLKQENEEEILISTLFYTEVIYNDIMQNKAISLSNSFQM